MIVTVARMMEKITGSLLGGIAAGVQAGNVIVCLTCIVVAASVIFQA